MCSRSLRERLQKRDPHICSEEAERYRCEGILRPDGVEERSLSLLVLSVKANSLALVTWDPGAESPMLI